MEKPGYTEVDIRAQATPQSFERGMQYYHAGAVRRIVRRGDQVLARVAGSGSGPYRVRVVLKRGRIERARCSCPYEWGGWCKHIVAVLIAIWHRPSRVVERASVESLVDGLKPAQLRDRVLYLAERHPGLVAKIEQWVEGENSSHSRGKAS